MKNINPIKLLLIKICLIFNVYHLYAQHQAFTTVGTQTFTPTWHPSVVEFTAEAVGGGGGGAAVNGALFQTVQSAGGGGGAYSKSKINVNTSTSYSVTVGGGGPQNSTTPGGNSSFGTLVIAVGGISISRGGNRSNNNPGAGGQASASTGTDKFSGGNGGAGSGNNGGGGGGSAGSLSVGSNGFVSASNTNCATNSGGGAPGSGLLLNGTVTGRGGKGGNSGNTGGPGCSYGAGGGGASANSNTSRNGGDGFQGIVLVSWSELHSVTYNPLCGTAIINGSNLANTSSVTLNGNPVTIVNSNATSITINLSPGASGTLVVLTPYGSSQIALSSPMPAPEILGNKSLCGIGTTSDLSVAGEIDWQLPTGGNIITLGSDRVHTFLSNGTFNTSQMLLNVSVLVVGGGGGGGANGGGGGGAGGYSLTTETISSSQNITIGTGGAAALSSTVAGSNGGSTSFGAIIRLGGGGGASRDNGNGANNGLSVASGGGGGATNNATRRVGGAATQGFSGGAGNNNSGTDQGCNSAGGGGGGAGGAGSIGSNNVGGNGGIGLSNNISGATQFYAAGGGGGTTNFNVGCGGPTSCNGTACSSIIPGTGGSSIGGNGESTDGSSNTGSGGGAERNGASGIVIVRYTVPTLWTSSNTSVATVNPHTGLVTAIGLGTTNITYTNNINGCTVTEQLTVNPLPTGTIAGGASICNGQSTALTMTLTGTGPFIGTLSDGTAFSGSSSPLSVNVSPSTNTTFTIATLNDASCSAIGSGLSGSAAINVSNCSITWNGAQSSNWNDPLNWTPNGIPNTCSADVSIPSGTPNNPSISSSNVQVGNLSISASASLNIITGRVLNVCKDWTGGTGSSADVTGDGRVTLNGTVAQDINGNTNFSVLRLNNGLGATLNGNATISQLLELENGAFSTSGTRLTFLSPNENSCGIVDNFTTGFSGTLNGPVVAQRGHVTSQTYAQHYMSSPVNSASFTNFVNPSGANGVAVTPTTNCDETTLQSGSNYGAAFEWNQALGASCMLAGWVVRSTGTMENGKGYSLIPKANPSVVSGNLNFNASYSQTNLTDAIWTNTSLQTRPYNSGWHLVGNPYLAYLDPSDATNTDFENIGGVWHTNGTFAGTYQPLNLSSSDVVAPFQAFMVHKSTPLGSSTFTVNATERRIGSATFYKSNLYALSLLVNGNGYNDITYIDFDPNSSTNFDAQFDGYKLPGRIDQPALFSLENNQWLSVQTNPDVASKPIIPLGFMAGANGQFSITADGADAIQNTQVFLKDNKTGTRHNLTLIPSYSFAGLTTDVTNRFELQFEFKNTLDPNSINNLNDEIAIFIYPIPAKDVIVFKTEDSKHLKVELVSVEGKNVANFDFVGETTYDLSTISAGVYMAYITDEANNKIVKRIVKE